jgi:hypothetical protein
MFNRIRNMGKAVMNAISGQGGGSDMAGATGYCQRPELHPSECEDYMRVPVIRNIVECVPDDIVRAWRIFEAEKPEEIFKIEKKYDLTDKVHSAIAKSKVYGGVFVLPLYIGDEEYLKKPLSMFDKITGFKIIPQHLVIESTIEDICTINFKNKNISIHKSRIYPLAGKIRYDDTTNFSNSNGFQLGQSEVDLVVDAFLRMEGSDQQLNHLMAKVIVDTRGQEGLTAEAERASKNPIIAQQFADKQYLLAEATNFASNHQGIVYDKDKETVGRLDVANGVAALVAIPERYTTLFVIASGYPRTKVLGEQQQGLNTNGGADIRRYYDKVEQFRTHKVYDLLAWMDARIEASERITLPKWKFGNLWQMTETEQIEYENKVADRDSKYFNMFDTAVQESILTNLKNNGTYPDLEIDDPLTIADDE